MNASFHCGSSAFWALCSAHVCLHGWCVVLLHPTGSAGTCVEMQRCLCSFSCPSVDIHASRGLTPKSFVCLQLGQISTGYPLLGCSECSGRDITGVLQGGELGSGALLQEWIPAKQRQTNELLCGGAIFLQLASTWDFFALPHYLSNFFIALVW